MSFLCMPLGGDTLSEDMLSEDKRNCRKFGPCGVGDEAIYLNGRFLDRRYYMTWRDVDRVYKRIAMSKGGFTGHGVFGTMPFLVVVYGGSEREFPFKREDDLDRMLDYISDNHPEIPTHSMEAMRKLEEAEAEERARYAKDLSEGAKAAVSKLEGDIEFLEERPSLYNGLVDNARQKRIVDNIPTSYRVIGIALAVVGIAAIIFGLLRFRAQSSYGLYIVVAGAAAFFTALSSNLLPNKRNNPDNANKDWLLAVEQMKNHLKERPDFDLPAQYAHPVVLTRVSRVIREGRADNISDAFELMKDDLKALNSSVTVSQKEHDEVVTVKPLFLVCDYKDEI